MPTYDYECRTCLTKHEYSLPIMHETPACEVCGESMFKIFTAVPVKFNASGFYSTGG